MPPKKSSTSSRSEPTAGSTGGTDTTGGTNIPVTGDGGTPGEETGTSTGIGGVGTTGETVGTLAGGATLTRTPVIQHIIKLCGFADDSIMVSYIDQEQWQNVFDVITHHFKQIDDFIVIRENGKSSMQSRC